MAEDGERYFPFRPSPELSAYSNPIPWIGSHAAQEHAPCSTCRQRRLPFLPSTFIITEGRIESTRIGGVAPIRTGCPREHHGFSKPRQCALLPAYSIELADDGGLDPHALASTIGVRSRAGALVRFIIHDWRGAGALEAHAPLGAPSVFKAVPARLSGSLPKNSNNGPIAH